MEAMMSIHTVEKLSSDFSAVTSVVPLKPIHTDEQYDHAVELLNQLLDAGAANENHPLADLVNTLGSLIGDYDDSQYPSEEVTGIDMLRFLMDQFTLTQGELPEIGTQGVVSEILNGKRDLNLRQIRALASRFNVPVQVFI